jgi:hypothetical protein
MEPASHLGTSIDPTPQSHAQLAALISSMRRTIRHLEDDIKAEEDRTHVFDPRDAAYPILAQNLRARRGNLLATISILELHLNGVKALREWAGDRAA